VFIIIIAVNMLGLQTVPRQRFRTFMTYSSRHVLSC